MRGRDERRRVVDIEASPFAVQRPLVRASVPGRSPWIDHEHVPAAAPPVGDTGPEVDLPLIGRATVDPHEQAAAIACVAAGVEGGAVVFDRDEVRLGKGEFVPAGGRADGEDGAVERPGVVPHDLGGCAGARAQRHDRLAGPPDVAVSATTDIGRDAAVEVDDREPAEAEFVPADRNRTVVGGHGVRSLTHAPGRPGLLDRLRPHRSIADLHVQPARAVVHAGAYPAGCVAGLLDRAAVRAPPLHLSRSSHRRCPAGTSARRPTACRADSTPASRPRRRPARSTGRRRTPRHHRRGGG